jgi:hypothetical protein
MAEAANKVLETINSPEIKPKIPIKNIRPVNTSLEKSLMTHTSCKLKKCAKTHVLNYSFHVLNYNTHRII